MDAIHNIYSPSLNRSYAKESSNMLQLTDMFTSDTVAPSWEEVVTRVVKDHPRLEVSTSF